MPVRISKGRRRIEMCEIKDDTKRHVTFSKRRSGLFKKASELCCLTGAEIVVIVKSPGRQTFFFGYPSSQIVIDRYENVNSLKANDGDTEQLMEFARNIKVDNLMTELAAINEELEKEKAKSWLLNQMDTTRQAQDWFEKFVDITSDEEQLKFYEKVLKKLSGKVAQEQVEQLEQNAAMGDTAAVRDFIQPSATTVGSFHEGESSSHSVMNHHDPMLLSPPLVEPLDMNLKTRQSF